MIRLAPWTAEHTAMLHKSSTDHGEVRQVILRLR